MLDGPAGDALATPERDGNGDATSDCGCHQAPDDTDSVDGDPFASEGHP
jgi:hypothetical protein